MKSILKLRNIYDSNVKNFLDHSEKVIDSLKGGYTEIDKNELSNFIFNKVLVDLHLSRYAKNKYWNIYNIDIMPDSFSYYDDKAMELDININENEIFNAKESNKEANKELATTVWKDLMLYGGEEIYNKVIENIIKAVEKINPEAAKKMRG